MKTIRTFYLIMLLAFGANVFAQMPKTLTYQGYVVDGTNQPLAGSHSVIVKLYDQLSGGAALHSETFTSNFEGGVFNVILGTQTAFSPAVAFDKQYWLGISIDGGAEMSPRSQLAAAPYAMMANAVSNDAAVTKLNGLTGTVEIEGANGATVSKNGNIITISAPAGGGTGIQGVQSSDGSLSVSNPNGPTATINLANNGVKNVNIADNAVNTDQIADGAVTMSKIGANQVGGVQILGLSVNTAHLANDGVTTAKIADEAVTPAKINTAGASNGNVLTYNGADVVWATPAGGGGGITTLTNGDGMISITNPNGPIATLNITNNSLTAGKLNTDPAMLAKVSGNFFTASGAGTVLANADMKFMVDTQAIMFPTVSGASEAMIYMFPNSGNDDRMVLGHSPAYPAWGLLYKDAGDEFRFLNNGTTVMNVDLGGQRVGIGDIDPAAKLEVVHSSASENTILARQTSTSSTASTIKATTASTSTDGMAIEGVSINGTAIVGQNNSSNRPALTAINTSASANSPIMQAKTSTGAGYVMQVDKEGDMYLYGHLSANQDLGSGGTPAGGGVYYDNVIYAWGDVAQNGSLVSGFGMSVSKTGTGTYAITYNKTLTNGSAPTVTAFEATAPQFAVISAKSTTGCTVKIWKFSAGSFSLVDSQFFIHVTGRPAIF